MCLSSFKPGADPHRFPPFYVFINEYILIKITLSKLKSGQYPVWMTQKPRKGDSGELKSKKFPKGEHALPPPPTVGGKGHAMPTERSARHFVFFRLKMEDHGRMLLLIPWLSVALWVCHRQPNKKEINNPGTRKVVWNKATKNAQASLQRRAHIQRIYFAWP